MIEARSPYWSKWQGRQRFIAWFNVGNDSDDSQYTQIARKRTLIASLLAAPIYTFFAIVNFGVHGSISIAAASAIAALLAISALVILRVSTHDSLPGHCFTLSLAVQVFGEMAFNGGLQAPAAALVLLIVPASIVTGLTAVRPWAIITSVCLAVICVLDLKGLLPANALPPEAQIIDRMLSLVAGIIGCATLVVLFERQATWAIDKLRQERTDFKHRALHDTLTEMPNRSYFYEHAEASIANAKLNLASRVVFYFDIDGFKQINDHYGHAAGDALLVAFASRLGSRVRPGDLAARLAGDEFAMIAEVLSDKSSIEHLLGRLQSISHEPFELDGHTLDVGMSIGYACFPEDGDELETLLRVADNRMYTDKSDRREAATLAHADKVIALPTRAARVSKVDNGRNVNRH